jgi:hypothetical protein
MGVPRRLRTEELGHRDSGEFEEALENYPSKLRNA